MRFSVHHFLTRLSIGFFAVFLLSGAVSPDSGRAIDLTDNLELHGFGAIGYLESRGNNFLAESKGGTFAMNEFGLNLNVRLAEDLRIGGQVLSRKMGDYGDNNLSLDWALIDYNPHDYLGIKAGKVKMPVGFYNTERDLDFLRPMIFLPQSIYDETRRDSWLAHLGGQVYGNLQSTTLGDLSYQFYGGKIDYSADSVNTDAARKRLHLLAAAARNKKGSGPVVPVDADSFERENDYVAGAAFVYYPPVDSLRLGLTLTKMEDETRVNNLVLGTYKIRNKFVASLEYSWQDFTLAAEYSENDRIQTQFGQVTLDGPSQSWYVMLSYMPVEQLTFSVLYDDFCRLKNESDRINSSGRIGSPYPWRKDWGFAVRWDPSDNWTIKGEYHLVDGAAFFMTFFNPDGIERHWQYGAIKVSFNF